MKNLVKTFKHLFSTDWKAIEIKTEHSYLLNGELRSIDNVFSMTKQSTRMKEITAFFSKLRLVKIWLFDDYCQSEKFVSVEKVVIVFCYKNSKTTLDVTGAFDCTLGLDEHINQVEPEAFRYID